jgi:hypothetical protein
MLFSVLSTRLLYSFVSFNHRLTARRSCVDVVGQVMFRLICNPKVCKSSLVGSVLNSNNRFLPIPLHDPSLYANCQWCRGTKFCKYILGDLIILPVAAVHVTEIVCCITRNCIVQSPFWQANRSSATQEIPRILCTRRFITVFTRARCLCPEPNLSNPCPPPFPFPLLKDQI